MIKIKILVITFGRLLDQNKSYYLIKMKVKYIFNFKIGYQLIKGDIIRLGNCILKVKELESLKENLI